jgi:hypothetical protein
LSFFAQIVDHFVGSVIQFIEMLSLDHRHTPTGKTSDTVQAGVKIAEWA